MPAALTTIRKRLAERARRWAHRRQGSDAPRLRLAGERIYILPTAAGLLYGVMLLTMLAGAMNYNNNLAFAMTFLLAAVGMVAIYHTHRRLAGLRLDYLGAEPVFAGDALPVRFALTNDAAVARDEIFLGWAGDNPVAAGVDAAAARVVTVPLPTSRRGPIPLPALRVDTAAPLGLTHAWAWIHLEERPLVYPRPAARAQALVQAVAEAAAAGDRHLGDDDFAGLRAYQPGDSPRRIAWRSYARSGELLAREFRGGAHENPLWIEWDAVRAADTEARIAALARLVIEAFEAGRSWGLRGPGICIGPAGGREHLHHCLQALATADLPEGQDR
jgi:uncharacterized protein (DUF58 family)